MFIQTSYMEDPLQDGRTDRRPSVGGSTAYNRRGHAHKKTAPSRAGKGKKERGGTTDEEKKPLSVTVPPTLCTSEFSFVIRGTADHHRRGGGGV